MTLQNKLLVRLDGPPGQDFDLFIRHGDPVDHEDHQNGYDVVSWGMTADELITIEDPKPGTYYLKVHSYRGSGSYNMQVEVT